MADLRPLVLSAGRTVQLASGDNLLAAGIKAVSSAGISLLTAAGATIATFGAGGSPNATINGGLNVTGSVSATSYIYTGTSGSGTGGNVRVKDDSGTDRWLTGILGAPGARDWYLYNLQSTATPIVVSSSDGSVIFQGDPGGTEGVRTTASIYSSGTQSTFGSGSGQCVVRVLGGNSGTAAGAALYGYAGGSLAWAFGTKSAIYGGAYGTTAWLYHAVDLHIGYDGSTPAIKVLQNGNVYFKDEIWSTSAMVGQNIGTGSKRLWIGYGAGVAGTLCIFPFIEGSAGCTRLWISPGTGAEVLIGQSDPGGTENLRISGTSRISGPASVFGSTTNTNTTLTVASGSTGTGGGALLAIYNGATPIIGFGNTSAVIGGAYSATPYIYGASTISSNVGMNLGGSIQAVGAQINGTLAMGGGTTTNRTIQITNSGGTYYLGADAATSDFGWTSYCFAIVAPASRIVEIGVLGSSTTLKVSSTATILGTDPGGSELQRVGGNGTYNGYIKGLVTSSGAGTYSFYATNGGSGTNTGSGIALGYSALAGGYAGIVGGYENPGVYLSFRTTADNVSAPTERLRIGATGVANFSSDIQIAGVTRLKESSGSTLLCVGSTTNWTSNGSTIWQDAATHNIRTAAGASQCAQFDGSSTAGDTRMLLYCVDTGTVSRVKTGASGTGPGGSGRALYI